MGVGYMGPQRRRHCLYDSTLARPSDAGARCAEPTLQDFPMTNMLRARKGFTLIELLIVVVIIGILAAIAIPKFANTKSKAYVTAMKSDLRNLVSAQESFFSDSAKYTTSLTQLNFKQSSGVNAPTVTTYPGA